MDDVPYPDDDEQLSEASADAELRDKRETEQSDIRITTNLTAMGILDQTPQEV